MSAERVAAVAALLDGSPLPRSSLPSTNGTAAPARGAGRPPLDPSQLSQSPEAIRARRRREEARNGNGRANGGPSSPPVARSFTPATRRALPPPPPPPEPVATPDDLRRATGFIRRCVLMLGTVAAKLLHDDRMAVPEEDAQEAADVILDAWPELAVLDSDGKKVLAVMYVGSLIGERYGVHRRGPAKHEGPVAIVPPPAHAPPHQGGSLFNVPIVERP